MKNLKINDKFVITPGTRLYHTSTSGEFSVVVKISGVQAIVTKLNKKSITIEIDGDLIGRTVNNFRIKK